MLRIALRPRWIAALVLALAIAAGFALLSQWQLSRSISEGAVVERPTETTVQLQDVIQPQKEMSARVDGQRVRVTGHFNPQDTVVLSDRLNDGQSGFWVVAHLTTDEGAGAAVALGWTASESEAENLAATVPSDTVTIEGRLVADEGPQTSDFHSGELHALSMGAMVNLWSVVDEAGVYNGYLVSETSMPGLEAIHAPPPDGSVELNWLNIFYAVEWVLFAGFAVFLWWRLVRDVWLRERAMESKEASTATP